MVPRRLSMRGRCHFRSHECLRRCHGRMATSMLSRQVFDRRRTSRETRHRNAPLRRNGGVYPSPRVTRSASTTVTLSMTMIHVLDATETPSNSTRTFRPLSIEQFSLLHSPKSFPCDFLRNTTSPTTTYPLNIPSHTSALPCTCPSPSSRVRIGHRPSRNACGGGRTNSTPTTETE